MKVLIPVDDEVSAQALINFVSVHRWPVETNFRVIYVAEPIYVGIDAPGDIALKHSAASKKYGEQLTFDIARELSEKHGSCQIENEVVEGRPKQKIVEIAKHWRADLIVMGTHGRRGISRFFLGSVSMSVLAHTPCSVMVARLSTETAQPAVASKTLIALDDRLTGHLLVDALAKHSWSKNPHFTLVHVVDYDKRFHIWTDEMIDESEKISTSLVEGIKDLLEFRIPGAIVKSEVRFGYPADEIIEAAKREQTDMIVLGSHGKRGFSRVFPGSVSIAVNSKSPCSVLTVRIPPGARLSTQRLLQEHERTDIGSLRKPRLIAYLRESDDFDVPEQRKIVEDYCKKHDYKIIDYIDSDTERPAFGLTQAVNETAGADGLVVCDLDRLVNSTEDKRYQLRPLIYSLWHRQKVVVSILDGIDTLTAAGQETMIDLLNEWTDRDEWPGSQS